MKRRDFVRTGLAAGAGWAAAGATSVAFAAPHTRRTFNLKYAPHFGMFKHHAGDDVVDQIKFMADQGFRALEDNGMKGRSVRDQERIAAEMARQGMEMGVFVAHTIFWTEPSLTTGKEEYRDRFLKEIRESVDVARRVNARWMTVVPGHVDLRLEMDYQTANVVETLRRAADILEPHGLTMVLEPLNHWANHPGLFLSKIPQAYLICRAVDSPACKILFDIYHQQIQEGNLIPNMERAWDEIAYFQIGDNPGRKEPTTGEINYRNVFKYIYGKGYTGILGMEHGNSKPGKVGEQAVIQAYEEVDRFEA
ncbi:xylose isomerase [Rhodothermaceae bacterium RA]|nr:xylose isomerase [Rhodothermaceae bacterium RA]